MKQWYPIRILAKLRWALLLQFIWIQVEAMHWVYSSMQQVDTIGKALPSYSMSRTDQDTLQIAEKFKPVLHKHAWDNQPKLADVETSLNDHSYLKGFLHEQTTVYEAMCFILPISLHSICKARFTLRHRFSHHPTDAVSGTPSYLPLVTATFFRLNRSRKPSIYV